ncbi:integral membrane protein [Talaromyces stipitatus ATCC 10500]|uniref:Integral membrane protein n=1 Tax=Talaromyces stipitatus (strain ATCC 10500 / CBS 375.48 / QM 6759 / NRRL 1006) TaxID=441959 RepID=B8MHQ6_TALSN|nr:uncharacterized protein TSTA_014780 [Talaromyces stipitatus ATCC 10500]EED16386.1 integral membrane protein [Talaromyces stipitatus ATCC 10500]
MTSIGRIACIVFPYAVTVGALISLIFVGIGSTNSNSSTKTDLYFFRADLSNLTSAGGSSLANEAASALGDLTNFGSSCFEAALAEALAKNHIRDFYDIGLWGYCAGNKTSSGKFEAEFAFDPVSVWGLNNTGSSKDVEDILPSNLHKALNTYKAVSKWIFIAYIIAFGVTALELIVGLFAICSRLGSLVTSIISGVAFFFTAAASITATAMFAVFTGTFNTALKQYGMHGSMGHNIYVATWIATAFAFCGTLFWLFSSCCCAARSPYHGGRAGRSRVMAEKAPYTYERVSSPYGGAPAGPAAPYSGQHNVPMQTFRQDAYEPFRHV